MVDLEQQIRAWAQAAEVDAAAVLADDVIRKRPGRSSRVRSVALVATTAIFVVGLGAVAVTVASHDEPTAVTADQTPSTGLPVIYRVLDRTDLGADQAGTVHAASSEGEFRALWRSIQADDDPLPEVDFDTEVVATMTVLDSSCDLTLDGFEREETTVTAAFDQPSGGCERAAIPATFVVALDRASVGAPEPGDSFRLVLPRQSVDGFGDTYLDISDLRPGVQVYTSFQLAADTMLAGTTLDGTVQVYNNTPDSLTGDTCGPFFVAVLQNESGGSGFGRDDCLQSFAIPPGLSSYPVTARASYGGCSNPQSTPTALPPCVDGGGPPPLPPGRYEAVIDQASELLPDLFPLPEPVAVTVT